MKFLASADNPGGANAIVSVVKKCIANGDEAVIILGGVAQAIFHDAGLDFISQETLTRNQLKNLLHDKTFDFFLSGTSIGETIDKILLELCKKEKIPTVCVLDSWVNYWMRFSITHNLEAVPDYICVMDELARREMLAENFPAERIIVTGNPFFDSFIDGIDQEKEDAERILFISQPLKHAETMGAARLSYDEYSVLNDLVSIFDQIGQEKRKQVVIRLHPREEKGKFDKIVNRSGFCYDTILDIKSSISFSGLVIGMNSMALIQAALAGKKVISYQPNLLGEDTLVTNKFNLSKCVITKDDLLHEIKNYIAGNFVQGRVTEEGKKFIQEINIKNATEKVINFIMNRFRV